jgi:hypothetical protein
MSLHAVDYKQAGYFWVSISQNDRAGYLVYLIFHTVGFVIVTSICDKGKTNELRGRLGAGRLFLFQKP